MSRLNRFSEYLRRRYPFKVWKLPIDAGFTCPNRDGSKGKGGCAYCDNRSFSPPARDRSVSVREQIERGIAQQRVRGVDHVIAYFQAFSNTYAPIDRLRELYDIALSFPEVIGLAVATRPDCVPDPVLDLLGSHTRRTDVWLELGLESSHDSTLAAINRGHSRADFDDAVRRARDREFEIVCHLVFGLPGETREMMIETADHVAAGGVDAVKLHHLYVAEGTPLEAAWRRGELRLYSFDEWIALAADIIERLPATMYLERVAGELANRWLVAPRWGKSGSEVWAAIEAELERRGTQQGTRLSS